MNNPTCRCGHQHSLGYDRRYRIACRWFKRLFIKDREYVHTRRRKHGAKEIIVRCDCPEVQV